MALSPTPREAAAEVAVTAKRFLLVPLALACLQLPSIAAAQTFITAWGSAGAGDGQFITVVGVAVGSNGDIYVSDGGNSRVQVFTSGGTYLRQWHVPLTTTGWGLNIAVDASDNVYLGHNYSGHVYRYTSTGTLVTQWQAGDAGGIGSLCLAVDASGNVYVTAGHRVRVFLSSGVLIREWGTPAYPDGVALDAAGDVLVVDRDNNRILKFTSTGTYIASFGSYGTGDGQFNRPVRVAVGPQGTIYVVDNGNCRVEAFSAGGAFVTKWGSCDLGAADPGQFDNPIGVAVDGNGDIYVADTNNFRIQKFGSGPTPVVSLSWGSVKARYRGAAEPAAQGR